MTPAPESNAASGRAALALALVASVLLGVFLAIGGLALLGERALDAYREAGGTWRLAGDATDSAMNSLTEEGFGFPERDLDDPLLESRTIVVTEAMNERSARSVVRKLMFLDARDAVQPIELYLATPGGWFDFAFAIIGAMRAIDAPVNVTAIGGCHSSGAVILASATGRRRALSDALISVHANITEDGGEFGSGARERARVEGALRTRARLPRDWFPLEAETSYYLTAREALRYGLIDDIVGSPEPPASEEAPHDPRAALRPRP